MSGIRARRICVLSGAPGEYEQWLADSGHTPETAINGYTREDFFGQEFHEVVEIGTFWSRPDAMLLHDLAAVYKFRL